MVTQFAIRLTKFLTIITILGFLLYLYQLFDPSESERWLNQTKLTGIYQIAVDKKHAAIIAGEKNVSDPGLNQRLVRDDDLLNWLKRMFKDHMRFDAKNVEQQLDQLAPYFSEKGWENFLRALMESRSLELAIQRNTFMSMTPTDGQEIVKQCLKNGVYTWVVSAPAKIIFGAQDVQEMKGIIWIEVMRVPLSENKEGIGIVSFVADTTGVPGLMNKSMIPDWCKEP